MLVGNTDGGGDVLPTDKNNQRLNYGNSNFDVRHRFTFSPTYVVPGMKSPAQMLEGWSINGILALQSGLPWTAADLGTTDWIGTGEINNQQIGGGVYQYWNYSGPRSAFSNTGPNPIPCYGTYGGLHSLYVNELCRQLDTNGMSERGAGSLRRKCPTAVASSGGTRQWRLLHTKRRRPDAASIRHGRATPEETSSGASPTGTLIYPSRRSGSSRNGTALSSAWSFSTFQPYRFRGSRQHRPYFPRGIWICYEYAGFGESCTGVRRPAPYPVRLEAGFLAGLWTNIKALQGLGHSGRP